jgi:hypothetical protein
MRVLPFNLPPKKDTHRRGTENTEKRKKVGKKKKFIAPIR